MQASLVKNTFEGQSLKVSMIANDAPSLATVVTAVIAAGASLSASVTLGGQTPVRLIMPSGWTAATVSFQTSLDGTTWKNLYKRDGTELSLAAAVDRSIALDRDDFLGVQHFVRMRSGPSATPVIQVAAATLTLITKVV